MKELSSISISSGVNENGVGFLTVSCISTDKEMFVGQLDPETVRKLALDWLESAEAAEQDAAVFRLFRKMDIEDAVLGAVITELRNSRSD